jgi:GT2 family glycosyltransferase
VTCSLVLYKSHDIVENTIRCILNSGVNIYLYLIDNSPTDALKTELKKYIDLSSVEYVFTGKNLGFGAAHNIAIQAALHISKYHLIINPDITFEGHVIEELFCFMEATPNVGHVMPKIKYPDGSIQYVAKLIPTPYDLIVKRFLPASVSQNRLNTFQLKLSGYNEIMEAPYLSGCFMFLRNESLKKVGFFDERFFMYPEDIDLTRRINVNYKTIFYPYVEVIHNHERASYKSIRMLFIHVFNIVKYFNKWGWFFDKQRKATNRRILSQFKES